MAESKTKKLCDANFYKRIPTVQPYHLDLVDMGVNFVETIEKLRKDKSFRLDHQTMLIQPPDSYKPTMQEKFDRIMSTPVMVSEMSVGKIVANFYDIKTDYRYDYVEKNEDLFLN